MRNLGKAFFLLMLFFIFSCGKNYDYDVIIRNGTIYNGSGSDPMKADMAINADTIATIGQLPTEKGKTEINAEGLDSTVARSDHSETVVARDDNTDYGMGKSLFSRRNT